MYTYYQKYYLQVINLLMKWLRFREHASRTFQNKIDLNKNGQLQQAMEHFFNLKASRIFRVTALTLTHLVHNYV